MHPLSNLPLTTCVFSYLARQILCAESSKQALPTPLNFPPATVWDGNDGAWSSFATQIGSPPQSVRLLPATVGNSIWTVIESGCDETDGKDCPNLRGNIFAINDSTTWQDKGTYALPLSPEHYLPYSGNAYFGFDNITLDWPAYGGITLKDQIVLGYATTDFAVGSLGLSPQSFNITSLNDQYPSLLGTLSAQNLIPSTSYGYLAGAHYYSFPYLAFGSLVFGGYDSTRLDNRTSLTLAGGSDQYRPMLLGIESIHSTDRKFLSEPVIAALDSLVTQIWLPLSACQAFEDAFGLVWNETHSLYLLDDAQHASLLKGNASITFTLSTGLDDSPERLNITLPYGAFDLTTKLSLVGNESIHYFPLKRAANDTQYTLGRTFFQEVYLLADYDRGNVTLYPGIYPQSSVKPNIVAICPPNSTTCHAPEKGTSHKLSTGGTVGIVIGIISLLVAIGLAIYLLHRHKKRDVGGAAEPQTTPDVAAPAEKPELPATPRTPHIWNELDTPIKGSDYSGVGPGARAELTGNERFELRGIERLEMPTGVATPELEGDRQYFELPGSQGWGEKHSKKSPK